MLNYETFRYPIISALDINIIFQVFRTCRGRATRGCREWTVRWTIEEILKFFSQSFFFFFAILYVMEDC